MYQERNPKLEKIIDQLGSLLDLCYVFKSQLRSTQNITPMLIVLHQGDQQTITEELSLKIDKLFKTVHLYAVKIFSVEYARNKFILQNLFFIQHCQKENIIYQLKDAKFEDLQQEEIDEQTFGVIHKNLADQFQALEPYLDTALEYMEEEDYVKTLKNLYLYNKLVLTVTTNFHLGHEFEAQSIRELQGLIAPYDLALGKIYNIHSKEDQSLLNLLDQITEEVIYMTAPITREQIDQLIKKADQTSESALRLFNQQLKAAKFSFGKRKNLEKLTLPKASEEYQKIRKDVQQLVNRKIMELRPGHNKTYYKTMLKIDGSADILYHISGMLKVCIMALENENTNLYPNPNLNIQTTLDHILQLLPFEEIECLERIIESLEVTTDHYVLEPPRYLYA